MVESCFIRDHVTQQTIPTDLDRPLLSGETASREQWPWGPDLQAL